HGLECYTELMSRYKSARAEEARHAHQDLLELLAELGVLGPLAFAALVFALGRAGLRALREKAVPRAPPLDAITAPGAVATLGVALGALTLMAYGDVYDASHPWKLVDAAVLAVLVSRLVARALEDSEWARL